MNAILQRFLGRNPAPEPPVPPQTLLSGVGPGGYAEPPQGTAPYIAPYGQWAPRADNGREDGRFFDDRAPTDEPAETWYGDKPGNDPFAKNSESERRRHRDNQQNNDPQGWPTTEHVVTATDNPYRHHSVPTPPSRSPSGWRFIAVPLGIMRSRRALNGMHFSMADEHRTYELGGMQPARRFRNTYRMEPPPRDARNMDVPQNVTPDVATVEYVSPDLTSVPSRGGSYRL